MSQSKIKAIFDEELSHLKINNEWVNQARQEERSFVARRSENMEFLGDKLIGTPSFRFQDGDRVRVFDQLLDIDESTLRRKLHQLDILDPQRKKVASDTLNLSCIYLLHALEQAGVSGQQRERGQRAILHLLHYRFLGSLMAHYFPHEADRRTAEAAYAKLNYRYHLKQEGSWAALIERRCDDILSADSIHRETIEQFDDDEAIIATIADIQGRIREIVKKVTAVFYEVRATNNQIRSKSATVSLDEEMHVRDLMRKESQYKRYIHGVITDRATFIRADLVRVSLELIHTCPEHRLYSAMRYLSDQHGRGGDPRIREFVDGLLSHLFRYMREQRKETGQSMSIAQLLTSLRSLYLSSKIRDKELADTRELGVDLMSDALESRNKALLASVRSTLMVYIVLRTLSMDYYLQLSHQADKAA